MMNVWQTLKAWPGPVVLYGTGNGADKLLDAFALYGIEAAGVFASDGFVRHRVFRGYPVLSYAEARERFPGMMIAVAFASSLLGVMAQIDALAARHPLVMPAVPVITGDARIGRSELFDDDYREAHREALDNVRASLADEESRALFDDVTAFRLTGALPLLRRHTASPGAVWTLLRQGRGAFRTACDLGAYRGDTVLEMLRELPGLTRLLAFEPDPRSFSRLAALISHPAAGETPLYKTAFSVYNMAVWDTSALLCFGGDGGRGSSLTADGRPNRNRAGTRPVRAMPLDAILGGQPVDYIKFDVEGAEAHALRGAAAAIRTYAPVLRVALYHRTGDLWELPLLIRSLRPDYRLYLRRTLCYPDWDLDLLCLPPL